MFASHKTMVRPRVTARGSGEPMLLADAVEDFLEHHRQGVVQIVGGPGSGKTTALNYLLAIFPEKCTYLDDAIRDAIAGAGADSVTICTGKQPLQREAHEIFTLAPWTRDDCVEYLLAADPAACGRVMERLRHDQQFLIPGVPELWSIILSELASNAEASSAKAALQHRLRHLLSDDALQRQLADCCIDLLTGGDVEAAERTIGQCCRGNQWNVVYRLLRHEAVQVLIAASRIADQLRQNEACQALDRQLPGPLVQELGIAARDPALQRRLEGIIVRAPSSQPMAASILHAAGVGWKPTDFRHYRFTGASLSRADWPGLSFSRRTRTVHFENADLSDSNLSGCSLAHVSGLRAIFARAKLDKACLFEFHGEQADFTGADLTGADLTSANLAGARLTAANAAGAVLRRTLLSGAHLAHVCFRNANLCEAMLVAATVTNGDFRDANLQAANLRGLRLCDAICDGAQFRTANLMECNLEYVVLPGACFTEANLDRAMLTGSRMPCASFQYASLRGAGLADVDWEGADLREADLRNAMFHLGSTRSGLVGSPYPCHGSRTGFYTDDFDDLGFRSPEEIRKANLRGADLRGAVLDGADFYLVDLREALYDARQARHLRLTGAILERPAA